MGSSNHSGDIMTSTNQMGNETIDALCANCGEAFSAFLHEMAEKNEKVVCPKCLANRDCKPPKATKAAAGSRPARKAH